MKARGLGRRGARRQVSRRSTSRPTCVDQAKEYREKLIEAAVELDDDAHGRLPRRQGARRGDAQAADPQGGDHRRVLSRCCAARPSRTRACSRCSTRWSTICRRRSTCRRSRASTPRRQRGRAQAGRQRAAVAARLQDHGRPVRRHHHLLPHLFGHARRAAPASSTRPRTARSASAACC